METAFFPIIFVLFNLIKNYKQQEDHIDQFNNIGLNENKKISQNNLVSQLLPKHVLIFNIKFFFLF